MKLSEKILYCRKRAGLSQEALAEKLGVTRQAVSKWENDDAAPDLDKLLLLAQTFHVTTDWLLNTDAPEAPEEKRQETPAWVDRLPKALGSMLRRYGWLAGVRIALSGLGFILVGGLARGVTRRMLSGFGTSSGGFRAAGLPDGMAVSGGLEILMDPEMNAMREQMLANNPVVIMGTAVLVVGVLTVIAGVALAVWLKKYSQDHDNP